MKTSHGNSSIPWSTPFMTAWKMAAESGGTVGGDIDDSLFKISKRKPHPQ
jgi:hypothetical protein